MPFTSNIPIQPPQPPKIEFIRDRTFKPTEDLAPFFFPWSGDWRSPIAIPGLEEMSDPYDILYRITYYRALNNAPYNLAFACPGERYNTYCSLFLGPAPNMGSGWGGQGLILAHTHPKVRAFHFRLCDHKKVDHAGANHSRGWHPGHCELCGIDMTIDSGD